MSEIDQPPAERDKERPLSFEEWSLYYRSTEIVTEQRISTNRWNYSVTVAILIAIGALIKWSADKSSFRFVGLLGVVILSTMAMVFCLHWFIQIRDFKNLNAAKFTLLNQMAPLIQFNTPDTCSDAVSYEPFRKEWETLEAQKVAIRLPPLGNKTALSSSTAELFIPRALMALFGVLLLSTLIAGAIDWTSLTRSISPFSVNTSTTTATSTTAVAPTTTIALTPTTR
jgi:hypothetical protein